MITKKHLLWALVALVAAVGLWILVGSYMAGRRERAVSRAWRETLIPLDSVPDRFPKTEVNQSALTLEGLAAPLGIDLASSDALNRSHPSQADRKGFAEISVELTNFVAAQLQRPDGEVDPVPERVGEFLGRHEVQLSALRTHVLTNEPPRWEMDLSRMIYAPLPAYFGQMNLHRLLIADILAKTRQGRFAEAQESLEASWKINTSIRGRPEPLSQMNAVFFATHHAGVLRKMRGVPAAWQERLGEHDYGALFLPAMAADAWAISDVARREAVWPASGPIRLIPLPLLRPHLRFCAVDYAETIRQAVLELRKQDVCTFDPGNLQTRVRSSLWRWNILSHSMDPGVVTLWTRVCRLQVGLELTQKILQVKRLQSASRQGVWPRELPGLESSVCPGARWVYQVAPDGTMALSLSVKPAWLAGPRGFSLPVEYTERVRKEQMKVRR